MTTNFKTIEPLVILNCFDKSLTVLILTACEGEYGLNCNKVCGLCYGNEQCDYENGACPNGCEDGYKGSKCKTGNKKVIQSCLCKKKKTGMMDADIIQIVINEFLLKFKLCNLFL